MHQSVLFGIVFAFVDEFYSTDIFSAFVLSEKNNHYGNDPCQVTYAPTHVAAL